MTVISASAVRTLREKTGAGMMNCKKALEETNGDSGEAANWLRKKGLSAARKKAGRIAAEGLVGMAVSGNKGALVEINAETDFVSRNDMFQTFVKRCSEIALQNDGDKDQILNAAWEKDGITVKEALTHHIATIGEHMDFRRSTILQIPQGIIVGYVHGAVKPGIGRIGVLIGLESEKTDENLQAFGKNLAMHVAATNPDYLNIENVDDQARDNEKAIFSAQARAAGKSDDIIEKMIEGRLRKFYEETVLNEQIFVIDGKTRIRDLIEQQEKLHNHPIRLSGFFRMALGEGIERKESDFAAEVASLQQ